jgi:stage V sporulation protein S
MKGAKQHHATLDTQRLTIITYRRLSMDMIKVSANSRTSAVAGAIAGVIREHHRAEVQAIGAGAVNQAMKALVLATGYLKNDGIYVTCVPEFADVTIEDKVRTAIKLVIEPSADSNFSSVGLSARSMHSDSARV